ncbi:NUDIX domain-containing protein [Metabacillus arenae]|uniref:NUDIX domain-containing protein n=1 Tax=Metabacillus arenae TaxID=2771434 RepID=A0A926NMS4_9BACI|nr:NUDIX domain-containing protein [Metabacillus arenae]MBD1383503.1 NUDIX domain-containing protein [Metabacillus arenae]
MNRKDYYYDETAPKPTSIVPAVSAIVFSADNSKLLLQKRADNRKWSLPGGQVDPGENVEEAIIREVKEETGFDIIVKKLSGVYSDPNHIIAYTNGEIRQQFSICFLCEIVGGTQVTSEESIEVKFISIEELDRISIHPTQKIRIEDALSGEEQAFIR